jgi:cell division protein FtsQ
VATRRTTAPARAAVIQFPSGARLAVRSLVPTTRSIFIGLALLLAGAGSYVAARETSVFAITTVRVEGAPPGIAREVRAAAQDARGQSLLRIDEGALVQRLRALPDVAAVRYDRAFPHTLRLLVTPERPVALIRQGSASYVVSMRGRVIRSVPLHTRKSLARIWLPRTVHLRVGRLLHDRMTLRAISALDPLLGTPLPTTIANVKLEQGQVTLVTASKIELRLGQPVDIPLKLAIVRQLLSTVEPASSGVAYLDVSVPERAVTGIQTLKSQVQVDTSSSSTAGIAH